MSDASFKPKAAKLLRRLFATLLIFIGIALIAGGMKLAALGGSLYYALAGCAYLVAGGLFWSGRRLGDTVFGILLLGTLAWSIWESGLAPWSLIPRLMMPAALGLLLAIPLTRWLLLGHEDKRGMTLTGTGSLLCFAVLGLAFLRPQWGGVSYPLPLSQERPLVHAGDWRSYGNTLAGNRFSPLSQIDQNNVKSLEVAWTYRSGEGSTISTAAEATPIKIKNTLYTCTPSNVVVALDAVSGKQKWRFDPRLPAAMYPVRTCRGLSYFEAGQSDPACPTRIVTATMDGRLLALNAETGAPCQRFGENGVVSLRPAMGVKQAHHQYTTSPPAVVNGLLIVGSLILDNQSVDMPSGVVRAYDAVTGHLRWAWDMGAPNRMEAPPPGQNYTQSTPNAWTVFAADEDLGLVYVPTGNASPDIWGGKRRSFDEKYSSSIVALDVQTGRPRWSFQTVHHDLWDYDVPAQPALIEMNTPRGRTPALVQATKRGDLYVLDRRDGTPIVPVVEQAVPQGAAPGDWTSPTQPFSALSLPTKMLTEASMWGVTPFDQLYCRIKFRESRYEGMFTPPGLKPTIIMPGLTGAVNWGSVSIDADRNVLIANYMMFPWRGWLIPRAEVSQEMKDAPWSPKMLGAPFAWAAAPWVGPLDVPCSEPPWGGLVAIDLTTGKTLWNRPLGTGRDSGPLGIASHMPLVMDVPSMGGTLTTRGGLVFISGTLDRFVRAFDLSSGAEVWKARLPAGGQATPMTYTAGGRQYLVVTAGGHFLMGTKFGDYTIAYTLPASSSRPAQRVTPQP
jgi:membrane-bound PQQ-dependent dehydrogenase (glucose/quinate/shikimate family)